MTLACCWPLRSARLSTLSLYENFCHLMKLLNLLKCMVSAIRHELRDARHNNLLPAAADALLRRHLIHAGLRGCACTKVTSIANNQLDRSIDTDCPCEILDLGPRENGVALDFNNSLPGERLLFVGNKAITFFSVVSSGSVLLVDHTGTVNHGLTVGHVKLMAEDMAKQEMQALHRALKLLHRPPATYTVEFRECTPPHIVRDGNTAQATQFIAAAIPYVP